MCRGDSVLTAFVWYLGRRQLPGRERSRSWCLDEKAFLINDSVGRAPGMPLCLFFPCFLSQTRAMLWADSYLSTAWGPALRGLRDDAAQRPRGSALLPDAERAAVKVVWTAINKALDTALGQPVGF